MYYLVAKRTRLFRVVCIVFGGLAVLLLFRRKSEDGDAALDAVDHVQFDQRVNRDHDLGLASSPAVPLVEDASFDDPITPAFLQSLDKRTGKHCPDYVEYSKIKHPPFIGEYRYPYMRPAPRCRTFVSPAVEAVIFDLKQKVKTAGLARLIENCLPNTLDTTILWHQLKTKPYEAFVVTGDIHAEWLRDAARQLSVYQPFVRHDAELQKLILGAINTQASYINNSPYCNAFHPPSGSGVKHGDSAIDQVFPRPDWSVVFECKWELDSLALFLTLTNEYAENSGGDLSFINENWVRALEKVLVVLRRELQPSFDAETAAANRPYYSFQRQTNIGSETLPLSGVGNPVNYGTGLIRSAFRPSDDATVLQFLIPANAQMVTELKRLRKGFFNAGTLPVDTERPDSWDVFYDVIDQFIVGISNGIERFGIHEHPVWGRVYAYEVDGYGGIVSMDDANIPSLLSLPDMGFVEDFVNDEVYLNTRKMILSKNGNPYFLKGLSFEGIGGPHIGINNAWPMSLLVGMRTTDDDDEILRSLKFVMSNTATLALMHESVNVNSLGGHDFTRSWFAWCNSEFGKTILHLAKHKPHLIFRSEYSEVSYNIDKVLSELV